MENAIEILAEERIRLVCCVDMANEKLKMAYAPALVQGQPEHDAYSFNSYIDLGRFSAEQRAKFDAESQALRTHRARLCVLENFIKGSVSQETIASFNQYVEPMEEFADVTIPCNYIDLDENGNFTKYKIQAGPLRVESKREMTFEEYAKLYMTTLKTILVRNLDSDLRPEEIEEQFQRVCAEVYLNYKKKNAIALS